MHRITFPSVKPGLRPFILAGSGLIILHAAAWIVRDLIIDGQKILTILTIISITNLVLYALLRTQFSQFARMIFLSTYMFHLLYFLLTFTELRKF